jgi:hypothetical protein
MLQILGTDPGHDPGLIGSGSGTLHLARQLDAGHGLFGGTLIFTAANAFPLLIEQGHSLLGARQGVVPAVGLLPVPGRTVRITSFFAG